MKTLPVLICFPPGVALFVPETVPRIERVLSGFQKDVDADGFKYQKSYKLEEYHTYFLRSAAHRSSKQGKKNKTASDDLLTDERKDVMIAFRVDRISVAEDGGATLMWRELQRKDTAKIAMDEK